MSRSPFHNFAAALLFCSIFFLLAPPASRAVQREYLTPAEVENVRDNQQLDKRVGVFVKAAERRLRILTDPQAAASEARAAAKQGTRKSEDDDGGMHADAVSGTRAELLSDIAGILDEAITNVDDSAVRSEKSALIPKAVRQLAEACGRMLPRLEAMREQLKDENEHRHLELAIENAQQIVAASKKVPAEEKKEEKKKGEKKN